MKNKILFAATAVVLVLGLSFFAFQNAPAPKGGEKIMMLTTVESIIPMGIGRSKMFVTKPDGVIEEMDVENLYSGVGINFGNIQTNNVTFVNKINNILADGWELAFVSTGVQSPNAEKPQGIYMTRYIFKKAM